MAKEDFCFTYYDGDSAKDVAHMSRLERGCYLDIIHAQRKRGHLSLDDIKKVLGKDFDECWSSIEWILKIDAAGKFFIEWLDNSLTKAKAHSEKQKKNISKRYNQESTKPLPKSNLEQPLEDGDGNEDGNEIKNENGFGKPENLLIPRMSAAFVKENPQYPANKSKDYESLFSIAKFLADVGKLKGSPELHSDKILDAWEIISGEIGKQENFYHGKSLRTISNHIQAITQMVLHGNKLKEKSKPGSAERAAEYDKLFTQRYGNGRSATG